MDNNELFNLITNSNTEEQGNNSEAVLPAGNEQAVSDAAARGFIENRTEEAVTVAEAVNVTEPQVVAETAANINVEAPESQMTANMNAGASESQMTANMNAEAPESHMTGETVMGGSEPQMGNRNVSGSRSGVQAIIDALEQDSTPSEAKEPVNVEMRPAAGPVPAEPPKPKKEKKAKREKGKVGRFFGRVAVLIASGILFGLCAAVAFGVVTYYVDLDADDDEYVEEVDVDEITQQVEDDILEKIEKMVEDMGGDNEAVIDAFTANRENTVVTDVSGVVEKVMPSVVSIVNNYTYTTNFWGRQYAEEAEASGSGIIIGENDDELIIATNNHVIDNADTITVTFIDDSNAEAYLKGADEDMDIAVIAVKKDSLEKATSRAISIATLGNSDELKVGESAIAIGNALGYGQSVTTGVISALDRELEISEGEYSQGFIQTDAAINPGNSGGALLNVKGEVIGINSNKIGGSTVEGMGYAIPISNALPIIDNLKTRKTKDAVAEGNRGYLGISGRGVSSEMADLYDFPQGVYVYDVYPGTGAEAANLRKGDIITKFEGTSLDSMEKLQGLLAYYEAGDVVEVTIERLDEGGKYQPTDITIQLVDISKMPSE